MKSGNSFRLKVFGRSFFFQNSGVFWKWFLFLNEFMEGCFLLFWVFMLGYLSFYLIHSSISFLKILSIPMHESHWNMLFIFIYVEKKQNNLSSFLSIFTKSKFVYIMNLVFQYLFWIPWSKNLIFGTNKINSLM
jgi:hypothetical protein